MRALLVLLLAAGCSDEVDVCQGKPAACVSVKVAGSYALDELNLTATLPGGVPLTGRVADLTPPTFSLPVRFALLLPEGTVGLVDVGLIGSLVHEPVASGSGTVGVPPSGHASLTVQMGSFFGDLATSGSALDMGSDLNVALDAAPTEPTLTPGVYSFGPTLVGGSASLTLTFFNPKMQDAVISAVQMIPAGPPFAIDSGGSCAPATSVAPGGSCTVVVKFGPEQRGMVSAEARVSFGADGEASSFLDGLGVAWVAEGLEQDAGAVPTFFTLWGTALDDLWTGGDHATLYHRTQNGWIKVAPPSSATTVSAVWGTGVSDLWVASSASKELNHTVNGTTWLPTALASTGNMLTLWGASDLYAATSAGEIWHDSGNTWNSERNADSNALTGLWGSDDEDVWAVGQGGRILHRSQNGTWAAMNSTGDHNAVWGASAADVWIAGCDLSGTGCGFIKHLDNGNFNKVMTPKTDALFGLWGSSQSDIYAVGKGGSILHYDGSTWSSEASSTSADLRAVWGSGGEVFAVGAGGTILHRY